MTEHTDITPIPAEETPTRPSVAASAIANARGWDFALMMATVLLFGGLGLQSFLGTLYVWWAESAIPGWNATGYPGYIGVMNAIAAPQIILLVVIMGLCVPKRLFSRTALLVVSGGMLVTGLAVWAIVGSLATGLTAYLFLAALIQIAVVVMTIAGARGPSYLTEGRLTKTGSGLLHLGFIVFAIVVVALQRSSLMLPVFWASTALMLIGTLMSFYADKLAVRRVARVEVEREF